MTLEATSPPSALDRFLRRWVAHPVAVVAWSAALLVAGCLSASRTPVEWVPSLDLPEVTLTAVWPGTTAVAVERQVTLPIERALQRVPRVINVESVSEPGQASLRVELAADADLDRVIAEIGEQMARLRQILPERVYPRLQRQVPPALRQQAGFMTLQLVGPLAPSELRRIAEERVAPRLYNLAGLSDVRIEGGEEMELGIDLDPDRLVVHGLDSRDVLAGLVRLLGARGHGAVRDGVVSLPLVQPGVESVSEVRDLVLSQDASAPVRLKDVARIRMRPAAPRVLSRVDGDPVVTLVLERASGSHLLRTAERVRRRLATLSPELPGTVRLLVADDRSEDLRTELRDLMLRGLVALALVVGVLVVMLRSVKGAAVVLYAVTLSLSIALGLLAPFSLTFNLLTLAGLVLVFGLLVDNAVVVLEQIQVTGSAGVALRQVWLPLVAGTLSTVALLGPLIYLSGDLRQLFLPLGVILAVVLLISLVVAVLLLPVLARGWTRESEPAPGDDGAGRDGRRGEPTPSWGRPLLALYRLAGRYPRGCLVVCVLIVGLPIWLLPVRLSPQPVESTPAARAARLYNATLGHPAVTRWRPAVDRWTGGFLRPFLQRVLGADRGSAFIVPSEVQVRLRLPRGSGIDRTDSLLRSFEELALASPAVERTLASIQDGSATLRILWRSESLDTREPFRVRDQLIDRAVRLTGVQISIQGLVREGFSSGGGAGAVPFLLAATGSSYDDLERTLERFDAQLRGHSRVGSVELYSDRFGRPIQQRLLSLRPDDRSLLRHGMDASTLTGLLRPRVARFLPTLRANLEGRPRVPVRVTLGNRGVPQLDDLLGSVFPGETGSPIKLAELSEVRVVEQPARIERFNQQYRRYLALTYRGPYQLGSDFIDDQLAEFRPPAGIQIERTDRTSFERTPVSSLLWLLLGTLLVIFLVIASSCESWSLAALVLATLPLALAGVGVTLVLGDHGFREGAFIGLLLLLGIAVNDQILLVHRYRELRGLRPGEPSRRLVQLALNQRLRPMWTTTLTTVASMLPLMVAVSGDAGRFWYALAVTVVGGLLAATALGPLIPVAVLSCRRDDAREPRPVAQ